MRPIICDRCRLPISGPGDIAMFDVIDMVRRGSEHMEPRNRSHDLCRVCFLDFRDWLASGAIIGGDGASLAPVGSAEPTAATITLGEPDRAQTLAL